MHRYFDPLPSPDEVKKKVPLPERCEEFVFSARKQARKMLFGDPRLVFIVGPCSIHDPLSAIEYARCFKELSEKVEKTCFLVMRFYPEKSRTTIGWKGLLYDPYLDGSHDIETGLLWTRELLVHLAALQIPVATEFVDPMTAPYFDDLITWGFIGARTSSSQPHRQLASSLSFPIGFKNATDGNLEVAIQGILSARTRHAFLGLDSHGKVAKIQSEGNPLTHLVLRGGLDGPNYDASSVDKALQQLEEYQVSSRILIDCAHDNCQKQYEKQKDVFTAVLEQILDGNESIFGMMLESHLESGQQLFQSNGSPTHSSVSITDPCIGWSLTEELLLSADSMLSSSSSTIISFTHN